MARTGYIGNLASRLGQAIWSRAGVGPSDAIRSDKENIVMFSIFKIVCDGVQRLKDKKIPFSEPDISGLGVWTGVDVLHWFSGSRIFLI